MRARRVVGPPCAPRPKKLETSATPENPETRCRWRLGGPFDYLIHAKKSTQRAGPTVLSIRPCTSSPAQPSQPAHGRLLLVVPRPTRCEGAEESDHLFTSVQRVGLPWAYRRRERAAAAGPSRLRASQPTPAQARARGASVGAPPSVSTMSAAWRGHTLCSASAFGKLAGTRRNSWSASKVRIIRPASGTLGVTVESPVCVMRRRKRRTCL